MRPEDEDGFATEKYIDAATFREAIDRARTGGTE
jgi:hypothetical protein